MKTASAFLLSALVLVWACLPNFAAPQLEPDDYRYLSICQDLEAGKPEAFERSLVIENRWDHLWWVDVDGAIRFFRPLISWSYLLDRALFGEGAFGHLLANLSYHLACLGLLLLLVRRWFGPSLSIGLAAGLPFAAAFCHGEVLWYVAGRTDTLAAFFFLLTIRLHSGTSKATTIAAPIAFFLAVLTKETAVFLPLVLWLLESRVEGRPPLARPRLWISYLGAFLLWLGLRTWVLSGIPDAGWIRPYFFDPLGKGFLPHVGTALASYLANLSLAVPTDPFLEPSRVFARPWSLVGLFLGLGLLWILYAAGRRTRLGLPAWWLAGATLLPTLPAYVSERYLYLPTAAFALLLAAGFAKLRSRPAAPWTILSFLLLFLWTGHQAVALEAKQRWIGNPPEGAARWGVRARETLLPWKDRVPEGRTLLLLDFPGDWLAAQFLAEILRVQWKRPDLDLRILTPLPRIRNLGRGLLVSREGRKTLRLRSEFPAVLRETDGFPWLPLEPGTRRERPRAGLSVEILEADGMAAFDLKFHLDRDLRDCVLLRFVPSGDPKLHPRIRIDRGGFRRVRL